MFIKEPSMIATRRDILLVTAGLLIGRASVHTEAKPAVGLLSSSGAAARRGTRQKNPSLTLSRYNSCSSCS